VIRRALVRAIAALAGLLLGFAATIWVQGDGPASPSDGGGTSQPAAPPRLDAAPLPEPESQVLLAWTPRALDPGLAEAASTNAKVEAASVVRGGTVDLVRSLDGEGRIVDDTSDGWFLPLDAVAVDPTAHAAFAPGVDRAAVAALQPGEAVLSRGSAELRRLGPGARLELRGGHQVLVTAVVDDTTIGAAELAVGVETGAQIGLTNPRYALLAYDGDRAALETELRAARRDPAVEVRFRAPGETPFLRNGDAVLPPLLLKQRFGEFAYRPAAPGRREVEQDPVWQSQHLAERTVPIVGRMRCHRAVLDAIEGAMTELAAENLAGLVDPASYAGCWNPRLVAPGGDLSHHAWGVAFDLNYDSNPTGHSSVQDPRLVAVLERWGFTWGGDWLLRDPAHFEYLEPP
jgi:D-alanyl-D-alanine carboxypeptidase-like protein